MRKVCTFLLTPLTYAKIFSKNRILELRGHCDYMDLLINFIYKNKCRNILYQKDLKIK